MRAPVAHLAGPQRLAAILAAQRIPGTTVVVEGPAGIGKTHLVETCVAAASASTRVVRTMAQDVDAHTPFSALRPLLAAAAPVADLLEAAIAQVDA